MKTLKVITEFEVPDDFNNEEALAMYVQGSLDNSPEPSDIDDSLKDVEMGFTYGSSTRLI